MVASASEMFLGIPHLFGSHTPPHMTHIQALRKAGYLTSGDRVVAYTDGSCLHNGRTGARGGIGVSWGKERDDRSHDLRGADLRQGHQVAQRDHREGVLPVDLEAVMMRRWG